MLEIIHDVAPGASLGFYGALTSLELCEAVSALESSFGAEVVVDDLGFFAEPYFENGLVAKCVAAAVAAGVVYVSAAAAPLRRRIGVPVHPLTGRIPTCTGP